ncbi:hypothetical protein [Cesiribacter sp. SM1]|uniref:hypothetical protein n=1 Tax=Cesiribacter sp. SM1 TaxID=2861196 RepID=UPI001CD7D3D4|nr:hypothetical protein [Cesiribacter sp. SM1]
MISFNRTLQGTGPGRNQAASAATAAIDTPAATASVAAAATTAAALKANNKGLKIAKTTMPDRRLDYNQTFQHIRQELDGYYKERIPIFNNTINAGRSLS